MKIVLLKIVVALSLAVTAAADPPPIDYDVRYSAGQGATGLLDLHLPPVDPGASRPAVLVVHGGGWAGGDKWVLDAHARQIAATGAVVLNVNYRLAPAHPFPAAVDDIRTALLYLVDHAADWSVDLNRVGLFGYSAGGHLTGLIATLADEPIDTRTTASDWPADDSRWSRLPKIAAYCGGAPPLDLRPVPPNNRALAFAFGGSPAEVPGVYAAASPAAFISAGDPPSLIIHGDRDALVPIAGSRQFVASSRAAGVESKLIELPAQGHMVTVMHPLTMASMVAFFQKL